MSITGIGSIADLGGKIIDKIWPSPEDQSKRDEAKANLIQAQQSGELQQLQNIWDNANRQLDVSKAEAQSDNLLVAGWRPFIGWVCGSAFAYNFVAAPMIVAVTRIWQPDFVLPDLDMSQMLPVLLGMLGLGGLRTYEKRAGVAKKSAGA